MMRLTGSCCIVILAALVIKAQAQLSPNPDSDVPAGPSAQHTITLSVPPGTPLQVALDREVHIKRVGQSLQGHLMQPVYAFDHLVLPLGTRVEGRISKIGRPTGKELTFSILNADFTPTRPIEVSFDRIVLADGTRLPLHASVVPGPARSFGWWMPALRSVALRKILSPQR